MSLRLTESEVREIFNTVKISSPLLKGLHTENNPVIAILGGQSAAGKSNMTNSFKNLFPEKTFLSINGDLYRTYHPNHDDIAKYNVKHYSAITQNFSNIFTQELLTVALNNKFNVIVEGTMRNSDVTANTAKTFRENGFEVHACVIAAHPAFTELGIYKRYQEQVKKFGYGRLADVSVHDEAVTGLLNSVNHLYQDKLVDYIHIYSYLAEKKVVTLELQKNGNWNTGILPSVYIEQERNLQQSNKYLIAKEIKSGKETLKTIDVSLKNKVSKCIDKLNYLQITLKG
jgi:chloramphenicol 3-O-phosphotransferase